LSGRARSGPQFVAVLARHFPFYAERHQVRPGLTGWAQVNFTTRTTFEDSRVKLEYDLYYVKNCSLFLDLVDPCADGPDSSSSAKGRAELRRRGRSRRGRC
jgi:hypothetical protein